jgi:hypothetical protein
VKRAAAWILPGLAVAVLLGGTAWTLVLAYERGRQVSPGSTHRSDHRGARALFLLLEEMGHRPVRWTRPLPPKGALLVALEPEAAPTERDRELTHWVHEGGMLLLAAGDDNALAGLFGLALHEGTTGPDEEENETTPRWWTRYPRDAEVVRGTAAEPVVVQFRHGQGRVAAVAAPAWLENASLAQEDHLDLALQLVLGPGRPIHFDEYRHGLREQPGLAYVLHRYGLLPAAFAGLAFLGLLAWRTTPPEAEPPAAEEAWGPVRDSLVEARATLYARSLRPRDALGLLERDLRRGLSSYFGSRTLLPWPDLQRRLQERRPAEYRRLRRLLGDLQGLKAKPPLQLGDVVPLSRRMAALMKELR